MSVDQSKESLKLADEPQLLEPHELVNQIVSGDPEPKQASSDAPEAAATTEEAPAEETAIAEVPAQAEANSASDKADEPAQQETGASIETVSMQSESIQIASMLSSMPLGGVEIISSLADLGISDDDSSEPAKTIKPSPKFKAKKKNNAEEFKPKKAKHAKAASLVAKVAAAQSSDAVENVVAEKVAVEKVAVEKVAVEKVAVEKVAVEKVVAEKVVAEKVVAEKVAEGTVADEKVVSENVAAETVAEKTVAEKTVSEAPAEAKAVDQAPVEKTPEAESNEPLFSDLALNANVLEAVTKSGYTSPTPIQAEIIPYVLDGRDILAQSQTGTGKTAAFALPILSKISESKSKSKAPRVLVLAPTRELAIQVSKSFATYGSCLPDFQVAAIYGGQDYEPQLRQLRRGVDVVVGTPGRVIDHIKRETLDLSNIQCLVLDEADEMLNMGFLDDVEFVLEHTPKSRQIALFSATLPKAIRNISERYLSNPAKVTIRKKTMTADSIRQRAVFVNPREKVDLLVRFLEAENADGTIVFTRTRETTNVVAEKLVKNGLSAFALNGEMPQRARERTIQRLKSGQLDIVVATDVAARGLDVQRISHVFNFDLPEGSDSYVHRIGRTGRAGRKGEAIIFLSRNQRGRLRMIENATKQPIEIAEPPTTDQINVMRVTKFKEKIAKTIEEVDLGLFEKMIAEFAETSEQPYEKIAAAVAHMGQNGRHFFMKDRPRHARSERSDRSEGSGDRRGRHSREDRYSSGPSAGMKRFRLAVGKRDGVRPGSIVGAIANEAGIDGSEIGGISIHQSYSTVDLPESEGQKAIDLMQYTRICGRMIKIEVAREGSSRPSKHHKRRGNDRPRKARTTRADFGGSRNSDDNRGKKYGSKNRSSGGKSSGGKPSGGKSYAKKSSSKGGKPKYKSGAGAGSKKRR